MSVFVNFSNHPSAKWEPEQVEAAQTYGHIVDVAFPIVQPNADENQIEQMADEAVDRILSAGESVAAVMVQGEYTLTFAVVNRLISKGIKTFSACTERNVIESVDAEGNRIRESRFRFIGFREYRRPDTE